MSLKDYAVMPLSDYVDACDAIRAKTGTTDTIASSSLKEKILNIETGADTSGVTATPTDVIEGTKFVTALGNLAEGQMPNNGAVSGIISTKAETYAIPEGYHDGNGSVAISSTEQAKIKAANIKSGVNILGVNGTYRGPYKYITGSFMAGEDSMASYVKVTNSAFTSSTTPIMWYIYAKNYSRTTLYIYLAGGTGKTGKGFTADKTTPTAGTGGTYYPITVTAATGSLTFTVSSGSIGVFDYGSTYNYYILI